MGMGVRSGWGPRLWMLALSLWVSVLPAGESVVLLAVFPDRVLVQFDGERVELLQGMDAVADLRLLSSDTRTSSAWVEVQGQRHLLVRGGVPRASADLGSSSPASTVSIQADPSGSFVTIGGINGRAVHFLVDPGSAAILIGSGEARRLGIQYSRGRLEPVQTPEGIVFGYRVLLDRVRVGSIEEHRVEALVLHGQTPRTPVLGRSFLDRMELRSEGGRIVLQRR